jgi:hypothetical protein
MKGARKGARCDERAFFYDLRQSALKVSSFRIEPQTIRPRPGCAPRPQQQGASISFIRRLLLEDFKAVWSEATRITARFELNRVACYNS